MRTDLLVAIFNHIKSNPDNEFARGITDSKTGEIRYFLYEHPDTGGGAVTYPYAVSSIVSQVDGAVMEGGSDDFQWQISIYGGKITLVNDLSDACRSLFDGSIMRDESCSFSCQYVSTVGGFREEDTDPWQVAITFNSRA